MLPEDLDRCSFSLDSEGTARNRADDQGDELFHDAEGIRIVGLSSLPEHLRISIEGVSTEFLYAISASLATETFSAPHGAIPVTIIAFKGSGKQVSGLISNDET